MAQRGINKVTIIGNVGQDPDVRFMPSGDAVANLTLATSETWKDKQTGEQKEKTEWHRVAIFGKLAEIVQQYVQKGDKLYIEGKLQTRKWQNQQGVDMYTTEIVLQGFDGVLQMLTQKQQGQAPAQQGGFNQPAQQQGGFNQQQQPAQQQMPSQQLAQKKQQAQQQAKVNPQEPAIDFDDDIPFAPIGLQYPAILNCM